MCLYAQQNPDDTMLRKQCFSLLWAVSLTNVVAFDLLWIKTAKSTLSLSKLLVSQSQGWGWPLTVVQLELCLPPSWLTGEEGSVNSALVPWRKRKAIQLISAIDKYKQTMRSVPELESIQLHQRKMSFKMCN